MYLTLQRNLEVITNMYSVFTRTELAIHFVTTHVLWSCDVHV